MIDVYLSTQNNVFSLLPIILGGFILSGAHCFSSRRATCVHVCS